MYKWETKKKWFSPTSLTFPRIALHYENRFDEKLNSFVLHWTHSDLLVFGRADWLVPVGPAWWGPSSGRAASGPWRLGCGWWRSRISWSWAGGAWRRSAYAWSSAWSCTESPGPWTRRHSHYSSVLRADRKQAGMRHTEQNTSQNRQLRTSHSNVTASSLRTVPQSELYESNHRLISGTKIPPQKSKSK